MPCSRLLPLAILAAALWPVWRWIALRAAAPGEGWELVALATAMVFVLFSRPAASSVSLVLPVALMLVYAASYPFAPPIVRAAIGLAALGAAASSLWFGRVLHLPLAGLLLSSLPVMASLNFYLGYPMRVAVGSAAALLLQMNGFAVRADGAFLAWNGQSIAIDAPCSGVKMLWAGFYVCFTLAAFQGLGALRTCLLALVTFAAVLAANVLRAAALFYVESGAVKLPADWHAEAGIAAFLAACALLAWCARAMARPAHAA